MALILQNRGLPRQELVSTLADLFDVFGIDEVNTVISTMLDRGILWEDADTGGLISLGQVGEEEYGRRHFESIVSTFNSPLLLTVMYGQREVGFVDPMTLQNEADKVPLLILGGRYWRVVSSDWRSRVVYVEPTENKGKASWLGSSRALPFALCQTIKRILIDQATPATLSQRAVVRLSSLAESFSCLEEGTTTSERSVRDGKAEWQWWTFAGGAANFWLAELLIASGVKVVTYDNFSLRLDAPPRVTDGAEANATLSPAGARKIRQLVRELKFSNCLPEEIAIELLADCVFRVIVTGDFAKA